MKLKISLIALAAVAMFGCGNKTETAGTGTSTDKPVESNREVTLRINGQKGDSIVMVNKMHIEADPSSMEKPAGMDDAQFETLKKQLGGPMSMDIQAKMTSVIEEIKDGNFHMTTTTSEVKASGEGMMKAQAEQMAKSEEGKVEKVVRNAMNKVVEGSAQDNPFALTYPEKAVKVGDTWEGDNSTVKSGKVKYTLAAIETVAGIECAVLEMSFDTPEMKTSVPAKLWIDLKTGAPVKAEGGFDMNQNGMKMKATFSMERA